MRTMQQTIETHSRKIASLEEENKKLKAENKQIKDRLLRIEKMLNIK